MKLPYKAIKEIAENLDCGMVCYIHKETKEIKSVIDINDPYADEEPWEKELTEIENNWDKYLKIEKITSSEMFQIMEDFTDQVQSEYIKERLINALSRKKPFRNFKYEIDENEKIRQQWFSYKAYRYEAWVKAYLQDLIEEENAPKYMGYYDDDGTKYDPDLYPLPTLCMSCIKKDDPNEEMLCNLTRIDQLGEINFKCFAYKQK